LIIESRPIRFEGDGYSPEWVEEAKRRGLTNITSAPDAIKKYLEKDAVKLLTGVGVFSEVELHSRVEIEFEKFTKKIQIEARVLGDLAINHIVPIAIEYQNRLIENIRGIKEVFDSQEAEKLTADSKNLVREIGERILAIKTMTYEMIEARKTANSIENIEEKTFAYSNTVRPYLDKIRYHIDKLEEVIDDEIWPLPKYRELLFMK
jgi:glutamine synthetase